jgi:glycosyltransferase involved in cell wall biosynthesis
MALSQHIALNIQSGDYLQMMNRIISDNGLDMNRVVTLLPRPNAQMARIYKNTDIGLFPNRCEGGTNLVLMEYMACGKPVIASYSSGHKDILSQNNSIPIRRMKPIDIPIGDATHSIWDDPDLEETIAHLEQAYQNRGDILPIGRRAGEDLSEQTWKKMGEKFYSLLTL